MKKQLLILGLGLITLGLILITSSVSSAQESNEITVPLTDPAKKGKLKAHLNYGSITVKGTARKDILVKYKSAEDCDDCDEEHHKNKNTSGGSHDGLKRIAGGGMDLEIVESNNYVKVSSDSWNNKMDLEIEVPSGIDLEVHTYNDGDLLVSNIQGECEITNYNGEITALNISGSVVATTYNGEIKVTFDKVTDGAPMSFSTYNGDIDITFPASLKASFKMKTEGGEIFTGFDMSISKSKPVTQTNQQRGGIVIKVDDWKRGDVNGGGAAITMKNYNGDILIRKK
jgi:hypothetical protein